MSKNNKRTDLYSRIIDVVFIDREDLKTLEAKPVLTSNEVVIQEAARSIRRGMVKHLYNVVNRTFTEIQKKVFKLYHKEGLSMKKVADKLGIQDFQTIMVHISGRWPCYADWNYQKIKDNHETCGGYIKKLIKHNGTGKYDEDDRRIKKLLKLWQSLIVNGDVRGCLEYLQAEDPWWNDWKLQEDDRFLGDIYNQED